MTRQEETLLKHMLSLDPMPPSFQKLYSVMEKMYGTKKICTLTPKPASEEHLKNGEDILTKKGTSFLQQSIEFCHNSIAVLATNMDKLAGNGIIRYVCSTQK